MAIALFLGGCYDVPKPDCGFRCGAETPCPDGYTCGSDFRCHREGSDPNLVCGTPDAAPPYSPAATLQNPLAGMPHDPNLPIRVRFDVDVVNVSATTFTVTRTGETDLIAGTVTYDAPTRVAVFETDPYFPENAALTIHLDDDILDPVSGRMLQPTTFDIMTSDDTVPPSVASIVPASGATSISVGTDVTVMFTEPVFAVTGSSFTVSEGGTDIQGAVTYTSATRTAVFDPIDQLAPNTQYTARLSAEIMDLSNNVLATAPYLSSFTTGPDTLPPTVRTHAPLDGGTMVPVDSNIVVIFDEPVQNVTATSFQVEAGAVTGTITLAMGDRMVTFDPDADLPAATVIDVTLSAAITDTSANALAPFAFSFTTN